MTLLKGLAVTVLLAILGLQGISSFHAANEIKSAPPIEAKYKVSGSYSVSYADFAAQNDTWQKYEVWYPTKIESSGETYPLIVMANGTGITASKYKDVFEHLASWGFLVVGNEDGNSRTGASSAASLDFMLKANADAPSIFYGKIDTANIGIAGHSQGGVVAINAVTAQANGCYYKALYTASTTSAFWGQDGQLGAEWSYDVSQISIPTLMVAGTGYFDAGTAADITATEGQGICPLYSMQDCYNRISAGVPKMIARRTDTDHGDMLRKPNGYMTAWFMYWLKGDAVAGEAFAGDTAEILSNAAWQDVEKNF